MSTSQPKRRKLGTSNALLKPFKSPMRGSQIATSSMSNHWQPSPLARVEESESGALLTTALETSHPCSSNISILQRQHTDLVSQLSSVRADFDILTQALSTESSTRDAELLNLIEVWQVASQQAAEEVYTAVRDRVNSMGGVRAWKQREREKIALERCYWDDGSQDVSLELDSANGDTEISRSEDGADAKQADEGSETGKLGKCLKPAVENDLVDEVRASKYLLR